MSWNGNARWMNRWNILMLVVLAAFMMTLAGAFAARGDEARCAWFSRFEWSSRSHIEDEIANIDECNMNAVLFQIRGTADAFYISQWEPWAEQLGNDYPGYDPLAVAIYEAHERGLELHAYVNAMPVWSGATPPGDPLHIYNTHPEWIMVNSSGTPMDPADGYAFASPGVPQFREHLNKVIMDIATKYDVDGIHLDYIRYPSTAYSYDDSSVARYLREHPSCTYPPGNCSGYWTSFRRDLVSEVVETTYDSVTALKPWLKVSASVWGKFNDGYLYYYQDSHGWLEDDIIDFTAPMIYTASTSTFQSRLHDHAVAKYGRHVYGGIGAYYTGMTPAIMAAEIGICRSEGVEGQTMFSATDLHYAFKDTLIAPGGPYENPESMPAMAWKSARPFTASVALPVSNTQVDLLFSSDVDLVTGQDPDNYVFDSGLLTLGATRDASDHRLVHLTTSTHYDDFLYTLTVTGVLEEGTKAAVAWPNNRRQFHGKSTAFPPWILVDNQHGAPAFTFVGYWRQSVSGECYPPQPTGTKHFHNGPGGGDSTATWTAAVDSAGTYALFFWVNHNGYTEDAHYIIQTASGPDSAIGDQNYEEQWNYLGTYPFSDTARVSVTNYFTTGSAVIADAICLLPVGPLDLSAPPAAVTDLTSHKSAGDIVLTWSAVTLDTLGNPVTVDAYVVYRNDDPSSPPADSIGATSGTEYTDAGAAGSSATNYFYVVRAMDNSKTKSALSNRVGEFDRELMTSVKAGRDKKTKDLR